MLWTCLTIKERKIKAEAKTAAENEEQKSFLENVQDFFKLSPEVGKICTMQFFSWIGLMSMMIFFTQYAVHIVYNVPDLSSAAQAVKDTYAAQTADGQYFSQICFAVFNLVCFLVAIPIGKWAEKRGNKFVHIIALSSMALAYILMAILPNKASVMSAMALAGIGWASTLALPFAMLSKYIKPGTEGSIMGIFNIFIAAPQVLVCTLLAWFIDKARYTQDTMVNNHWEYAFIVGAIMLILAAVTASLVKEKA